MILEGSSPLTRGKHRGGGASAGVAGLIPAHAGKTALVMSGFVSIAAHPRSRGENAVRGPSFYLVWGSSPLTRGKPRRASLPDEVAGLIPAHAGKTRSMSATVRAVAAHPRSRGENKSPVGGSVPPIGSSPLTRGKPRGGGLEVGDDRLIPAHAGKTCQGRGPRFAPPGSSPLTRGKPRPAFRDRTTTRLIPAHAGKTTTARGDKIAGAAHPRSRGENFRRKPFFPADDGSSPLTRGKRIAPH